MRFTILTAINYLGGGGGGIKIIYKILLKVDFLSLHLTVTVLTPQKRYLNGPSRLRRKRPQTFTGDPSPSYSQILIQGTAVAYSVTGSVYHTHYNNGPRRALVFHISFYPIIHSNAFLIITCLKYFSVSIDI